MQLLILRRLIKLFIFLNLSQASAAEPFKLLTAEPAAIPRKPWTLGLQQAGYATKKVYINTNPLMDAALTGNIGVKYATEISQAVSLTVGARYMQFLGSSYVESAVKKQDALIESFKLNYSGYNAFIGGTYALTNSALHLNLQYADVSSSKNLNLISAYSVNMNDVWYGVIEAGYDFENKKPRGSLGVVRSGENFGLRLGVTYVEINDPALNVNTLPILDFYWTFGG